MILRRLGNKQAIAKKILPYFPPHKTYIEPFFGAGGMFFNKPKAKYNLMNDIDDDVVNLFLVIQKNRREFEEAVYKMPIHQGLLDYWKKNEETDPIMKALRFILISNTTYLGRGGEIRLGLSNDKKQIFEALDRTIELISDVKFANYDFRKFINSITFRRESERRRALIYADPPYLGTVNNYSHSFTEQDCIDLFDTLQNSGCMFVMSEFDHPFILEQAKERRLNVIHIGERQNLKNRRTEILITNYKNNLTLF